MKNFFQTIAVAFGMFSAVPMPQPVWNEKNMRYMLCAFPLVGLFVGAGEMLWYAVSEIFVLSDIMRGAGFCIIPVLVTGGIHLDGFADTSDALSSYGSAEKKQKILDDPHCGAFAVIKLICYMLCFFALCTAVKCETKLMLCWAASFVLSRALSGFAVAKFQMAKDTGLAHTFASSADKKRSRIILLIISLVSASVMIITGGIYGIAMTAAAVLTLVHYRSVAMAQFGGISGDLAGWFLQRAELFMLAAMTVCGVIEGIL